METRKCNTCAEVKPIEDYTPHKACRGGRRPKCKACTSAAHSPRTKENLRKAALDKYYEQKDGYTYVYILPEEHYCGISQAVKQRMNRHRHSGNDTTGWEIIAKFENPYDAIIFEAQKHKEGWKGGFYGIIE